MKKPAFTMIELIFVIIIIGILASTLTISPVKDNEILDQEYNMVKEDLKYLKQTNLNQNFFDSTDTTWDTKTNCFQQININKYQLENNNTPLKGNNFDGKSYIKDLKNNLTIVDKDGNNVVKICFDNLGRAYKTDLKLTNLIKGDIVLTIADKKGQYKRKINIKPITGYIQ